MRSRGKMLPLVQAGGGEAPQMGTHVLPAGLSRRVVARFLAARPEDWKPEPPRPKGFFYGFRNDCLERTVGLTRELVEGVMSPRDIVPVLERERIPYVLLGLYGISGWLKEPRATEDVDVLVAQRHLKRTVSALCKTFPGLVAKDTPVVVRLFEGERAVADVMKAHHPLFVEALGNTCKASLQGMKVVVPVLEVALALKFFSMTSVGRQAKDKYQDAHDFINMVQNNKVISSSKLLTWGELAYAGGGDDLVKMVADARAGRKLEI